MNKLITEEDVAKAIKRGSMVIVAEKGSIITPLALDMIRSKKLTIIEKEIHDYSSSSSVKFPFKKIAIGSDHTGFKVKNILIKYLTWIIFFGVALTGLYFMFRQLGIGVT